MCKGVVEQLMVVSPSSIVISDNRVLVKKHVAKVYCRNILILIRWFNNHESDTTKCFQCILELTLKVSNSVMDDV